MPIRTKRFLIGGVVVVAALAAVTIWGSGGSAPGATNRAVAVPAPKAEPRIIQDYEPSAPRTAATTRAAGASPDTRGRAGPPAQPNELPPDRGAKPPGAALQKNVAASAQSGGEPPPGGQLPQGAQPAANGSPPSFDQSFLDRRQREAQQLGGPEKVQEVEDLYGKGMSSIDTPEGRDALKKLIEDYPNSNRAACGAVQMSSYLLDQGQYPEVASTLKQFVDPGTDALFGNGTPALAPALLAYGDALQGLGDLAGARAAWQRLLMLYPNVVDSRTQTPFGTLARQRLQ